MKYKKFTKETVLEMLDKGILEIGHYVITDHFLLASGKIADKAYDFLYKNGYASLMERKTYQDVNELGIIFINR